MNESLKMNQPLKKRLIGATILISLAVIFIPMLIGEAPQQQRSVSLEIPKPSEDFESKILALPEQQTELFAEVKITGSEPAKIIQPTLPKPPKRTKKAVEGISAWVVQVGSFSAEKNANSLAGKLMKEGYTAFVEPSFNSKGDVFRVRVGPEISKTKADALAAKIIKDKILNKAIVVQYP